MFKKHISESCVILIQPSLTDKIEPWMQVLLGILIDRAAFWGPLGLDGVKKGHTKP